MFRYRPKLYAIEREIEFLFFDFIASDRFAVQNLNEFRRYRSLSLSLLSIERPKNSIFCWKSSFVLSLSSHQIPEFEQFNSSLECFFDTQY